MRIDCIFYLYHICNMIIMKYIRCQNKIKLDKATKIKNKSNIENIQESRKKCTET